MIDWLAIHSYSFFKMAIMRKYEISVYLMPTFEDKPQV